MYFNFGHCIPFDSLERISYDNETVYNQKPQANNPNNQVRKDYKSWQKSTVSEWPGAVDVATRKVAIFNASNVQAHADFILLVHVYCIYIFVYWCVCVLVCLYDCVLISIWMCETVYMVPSTKHRMYFAGVYCGKRENRERDRERKKKKKKQT